MFFSWECLFSCSLKRTMNLVWARRCSYKKTACEEWLYQRRSKMRTHSPRKPFTLPSPTSHVQRIAGSWKLFLSTWVGFILCKTSQCSHQTLSRNKKSICFAILVPPLHQSHYIKKSKPLFITAFQSSSIIQSTLRTFTQWNGFYWAITHITWMQKRVRFSWMPRVV